MKDSSVLALRKNMTNVARSTAPVDTGNLKFNGIYSVRTNTGFKIVWDNQFAHYIKYQNEIPSKGHKGFVENGMALALDLLGDKIANKKLNRNSAKNISQALPTAVRRGNVIRKTTNPLGSPVYFTKGQSRMAKKFYDSIYQNAKAGTLEERNRQFIYGDDDKIVDIIEYD